MRHHRATKLALAGSCEVKGGKALLGWRHLSGREACPPPNFPLKHHFSVSFPSCVMSRMVKVRRCTISPREGDAADARTFFLCHCHPYTHRYILDHIVISINCYCDQRVNHGSLPRREAVRSWGGATLHPSLTSLAGKRHHQPPTFLESWLASPVVSPTPTFQPILEIPNPKIMSPQLICPIQVSRSGRLHSYPKAHSPWYVHEA